MPTLEDKRHEQYSKLRAKGMVPAKAAIAAGYATGSSIYTKLEADDMILNRVAELMEENELKREQQRAAARASGEVVGKLAGIGRAWVLRELAENAAMARLEGKFADSNAALIKIGEEIGMFKGTGDNEKDGGSAIPSTMDFDTLTNLADKAHDAINPPKLEALPTSDDIDLAAAERAMRLIEGQNSRKKIDPLSTGSETDVAMTPDAEPEPDLDSDEEDDTEK